MGNQKEQTGKEVKSAEYLKSLGIPMDWITYFGLKWWKTTEFLDNYAEPLQQRIAELEAQIQDLEPKFTELEMECKRLKAELKRKDEALEFAQLYLSTKSPEGFEAFTVIEQALKPKDR